MRFGSKLFQQSIVGFSEPDDFFCLRSLWYEKLLKFKLLVSSILVYSKKYSRICVFSCQSSFLFSKVVISAFAGSVLYFYPEFIWRITGFLSLE